MAATIAAVTASGELRADTPAQTTADTTTITIQTFGSNLAFEPTSFSAKAGTTVRIRYINEGTLPHNFVIARTDADIDALAAASPQAAESGHIPLELEDKMIAHTALASPGQTVEVTFTAPPPGEYTFVCLVPGHYNMMLGTFTSLE